MDAIRDLSRDMFIRSGKIENTPGERINIVDFKIGDLVYLKSGGPKMTVKSVNSRNDKVYCQWFVGNILNQKCFLKESLVHLSDRGNFATRVGEIEFDKHRRILVYNRRLIYLTPYEASVIDLFLGQPGVVFTHSEIVLLVKNKPMADNKAAEITRPLMHRLIEKIKAKAGAENWFQCVRGTGYIFVIERNE